MEEQQEETSTQPSADKGSNKMMLIGVGIVGVIIIAAGAYFLMGGRSDTESMTDTVMEGEIMEDDGSMVGGDAMVEDEEAMMEDDGSMMDDDSMMEGEVREITVNGYSFGYTPSALTMEAGEKIRLTFVSDDMMHDFIIEGTDIATEVVEGGDQTVIEFTAPEEPGEYTFYCSVGNHRAQGMEGTLTVE